MPLVQTRGAASAQGFGEFAQVTAANYIEDMFSTYLYTGNGSTQTITNGIDLSTKGGLVWLKGRSLGYNNYLFDTVRGAGNSIYSNLQIAQQTSATTLTAFGSTGFSIGSESDINENATTYVSWTFREQPKFFDIVTYTGTGSNTTIAHSLGAVPGCIMVKRTDTGGSPWAVYHRSLANTQYLVLNSTAAAATGATWWNSTTPTSSVFSLGTDATVNASAGTYVAYIFAHDAGGFGLTGTDNVISCGSFSTGAGGGATVTLGYEPQWLMIKSSSDASAWYTFDSMRGWIVGGSSRGLSPNTANAEFNFGSSALPANPTATGFTFTNGLFAASETWIYVAIRRGPMKVPTTGTSVFSTVSRTGTSTANTSVTAGFPVDAAFIKASSDIKPWDVEDRLRGGGKYLEFQSNAAEVAGSPVATINFTASNTAVLLGTDSYVNSSANSYANYFLQRAPSFFDEVCYTGTGSSPGTQNHNLGVIPEFILTKKRSAAQDWYPFFQNGSVTNWMQFFALSSAAGSSAGDLSSDVSATTFSGNTFSSNNSANTYVAYLFATCAGVSKVGKYTGTGTTLQINCGFTAGARFVLIKRTDSTGDWYVWDSARGIIAGNDPYLLLNSTAAEVTGTDYVDTYSAGFEISSTAPAAINASGGNFVFLAIA